jgi:hypothetical protein
MRIRSWPSTSLVLVLAAACGGPGGRTDVDAPPAGPPDAFGQGTIGTLGDGTITPTVAWTATDSLDNQYVILREGGAACQSGPGSGEAVGLYFRCGPIVVGTFPVRDAPPDCTNGEFFTVSLSGPPPYEAAWARSGSVEITSVSPTIRGTVTASQYHNGDYPSIPGSLDGAFEAAGCP